MNKFYKITFVLLVAILVFVCRVSDVGADDALPKIIITQVQAGGSYKNELGSAATQEFISIYNNGPDDTDISDWCINNKSNKPILCFDDREENITFHLPSHAYATIASTSFVLQYSIENPGTAIFIPDLLYTPTNGSSGSIVASSDDLTLINPEIRSIDNVRWAIVGDSTSFSSGMPAGSLLSRKINILDKDIFIDTNNTANDFGKTTELNIPVGGLYELEMPDVCKNIDGLQATIPAGKVLDEFRGCVDYDECPNILGNQATVPDGYILSDDSSCILDILPIVITELLPNAIGSDDGNEFIEIYNPNAEEVNLSNYILYIGQDDKSSYNFPDGLKIGAGQYLSFSDHDIKFTLVNTTSRASLKTVDDSFISEVPSYANAKEGQSWALIDGSWQWTNRPTPGAANLESYFEIIDDEIIEPEGLKPCAANQYRNPLTNRCKLIPEYEAQLAPCKDGQYRSEETNRCRSIASDVIDLAPCAEGQERNPATNRCRMISSSVAMLVPCAEGQERNPLTNRCRMIASAVASLVPCAEGQERNPLTNRCRAVASVLGENDLAPCKEGQERNPETNRCRNIVSMPKADFAPEKVDQVSNDSSTWLLLSGVGGLAVGYGVWEWRRELVKVARKIKSLLHAKK